MYDICLPNFKNTVVIVFLSHFLDLFPGEVQNLQAKMDTSTPSLILEWDKPSNCETDQDVTSYDIRFRPSGSPDEESCCNMTVRAPATSIVLTRESGLTPLVDYEFEVRAKNPGYDGKWSSKSKYIGMCINIRVIQTVASKL